MRFIELRKVGFNKWGIVDEEIINFLFEQLKMSLKEKIKKNSSNYKYIMGYSEIKKILKDKYDIDLNGVYEYEVDKMIKEIEKSIWGQLCI